MKFEQIWTLALQKSRSGCAVVVLGLSCCKIYFGSESIDVWELMCSSK